MLSFSKQTDYALLFLERLAKEKNYLSLSQLIKETDLPHRFLARIASTLVKHKIIASREGKVGGYKLTDKFNQISFFDFLKIFEKDLEAVDCLKENYQCRYQNICHHRQIFQKRINEIITRPLKKIKLKEVVQ